MTARHERGRVECAQSPEQIDRLERAARVDLGDQRRGSRRRFGGHLAAHRLIAEQVARDRQVEIEIVGDLVRVALRERGELAVHATERAIEPRGEHVALERPEQLVVRGKHRVEHRVGGDEHRQLRAVDVVVRRGVIGVAESLGHDDADVTQLLVLVGRELERGGDHVVIAER